MTPRNTKVNSVLDTTQVAASGYLRDFSAQYQKYLRDRNEETLALINRSVSLLGALPSQKFNVTQLEMTQFFVNLHALISALDECSDVLWTSIALLQNCSKNLEVRDALVENYRFVPLLTAVLKRTQLLTDKSARLLTVLQDLTYGIKVTWEEPYISVLLDLLKSTIYAATEEGEEKHALLSLSIMINLCYKNFPVLLAFLRSINISEFSRKIQRYGVLASKMLIVLSQDLHAPEQKELHRLLRSSFVSMLECLKDLNVAHLRHIVDFLTDSESHYGLYNAMLLYPNFCEDVERLLKYLEESSNMNDSKEEIRQQRQLCQSLVFRIVLYILKLSLIRDKDGNENMISLDSIVPRLFDFICQWIDSDICGTDAVQLLDSLIQMVQTETLTLRIARDPSIVILLLSITENAATSSEHTISILQLMISLLHQKKTEKLILSKITESYFDKIFLPLFNTAKETVPLHEIEKAVLGLLLLFNFSTIAKKAYFEKCCTMLQLPEIQHALAIATLRGRESVCDAVFQLSQFEHFPRLAVAKIISETNSVYAETSYVPNTDKFQNINTILRMNRQFASTETEERLLALIDTINLAYRNNQLNSVPTTKIMDLYNYKIEKSSCIESNMQNRLDDASHQITQLTQRINLQNAELKRYHDMNFELHTNIQSLETESQDLNNQRENLKRSLAELLKKSTQQSESLQISEKRLSVKVSELIALKKEHTDLQEEICRKNEQYEKLENSSKENVAKINKLKKTISAFESEVKDKVRLLEDREGELSKVKKALEEAKEAKNKSDGLIAVLEAQIQEKNEEIRNYDRELTETEELRKTIMSLMESKKPKRKN